VTTVNIVAPVALYGERLDDVDLRVPKISRFERRRLNIELDVLQHIQLERR